MVADMTRVVFSKKVPAHVKRVMDANPNATVNDVMRLSGIKPATAKPDTNKFWDRGNEANHFKVKLQNDIGNRRAGKAAARGTAPGATDAQVEDAGAALASQARRSAERKAMSSSPEQAFIERGVAGARQSGPPQQRRKQLRVAGSRAKRKIESKRKYEAEQAAKKGRGSAAGGGPDASGGVRGGNPKPKSGPSDNFAQLMTQKPHAAKRTGRGKPRLYTTRREDEGDFKKSVFTGLMDEGVKVTQHGGKQGKKASSAKKKGVDPVPMRVGRDDNILFKKSVVMPEVTLVELAKGVHRFGGGLPSQLHGPRRHADRVIDARVKQGRNVSTGGERTSGAGKKLKPKAGPSSGRQRKAPDTRAGYRRGLSPEDKKRLALYAGGGLAAAGGTGYLIGKAFNPFKGKMARKPEARPLPAETDMWGKPIVPSLRGKTVPGTVGRKPTKAEVDQKYLDRKNRQISDQANSYRDMKYARRQRTGSWD